MRFHRLFYLCLKTQRLYWVGQYARVMPGGRIFRCLVCLPLIRLRHILNDDDFISLRISLTTADSFRPYNRSMASKGVRSSHAISMILDMSDSVITFFRVKKNKSIIKAVADFCSSVQGLIKFKL